MRIALLKGVAGSGINFNTSFVPARALALNTRFRVAALLENQGTDKDTNTNRKGERD